MSSSSFRFPSSSVPTSHHSSALPLRLLSSKIALSSPSTRPYPQPPYPARRRPPLGARVHPATSPPAPSRAHRPASGTSGSGTTSTARPRRLRQRSGAGASRHLCRPRHNRGYRVYCVFSVLAIPPPLPQEPPSFSPIIFILTSPCHFFPLSQPPKNAPA